MIRIKLYDHWKGDQPLFAMQWLGVICIPCPKKKKKMCKDGLRICFGHPTKHLSIYWRYSGLGLDNGCPYEKKEL